MFDLSPADTPINPLYPDVNWNLSGFASFDNLLIDFIDFLKKNGENHKIIKSIHGSPNTIWQGGSTVSWAYSYPPEFYNYVLEKMNNDFGVGIFLTFTNHLLEEKHLNDEVGNQLLDVISSRPDLNGVILSSDLLSDYIRKRYPDLKQYASMIKATVEMQAGNLDYYQRMCDRFDMVVLHSDDIFNYELLEKLPKEKIEILVNQKCDYKCPLNPHHYSAFAKLNLDYENEKLRKIVVDYNDKCPRLSRLDFANKNRIRSQYFQLEDFQKIYDLGYRNFKLSGRGGEILVFLHNLTRFIINPKVEIDVFHMFTKITLQNMYVERSKIPEDMLTEIDRINNVVNIASNKI